VLPEGGSPHQNAIAWLKNERNFNCGTNRFCFDLGSTAYHDSTLYPDLKHTLLAICTSVAISMSVSVDSDASKVIEHTHRCRHSRQSFANQHKRGHALNLNISVSAEKRNQLRFPY